MAAIPPIPVAIADDQDLMRVALAAIVADAPDMELVGEAADADAAVEIVLSRLPAVLVIDLEMPGKDSLQAIGDLRRLAPTTPALVLAEATAERSVELAMRLGARGAVGKADSRADVSAAIRAVARGETYVSSGLAARLASEPGDRFEARSGRLSDRELEVLRYVSRGFAKKQIADMMSISVKTVDKHVTTVMTKLDIHDRVDLARFAIREGLVTA